jgi:hypothetical protein
VATSEPHQGSAYRDPVRLGGGQDQTVDRDRDQPGRHAGFALQPLIAGERDPKVLAQMVRARTGPFGVVITWLGKDWTG